MQTIKFTLSNTEKLPKNQLLKIRGGDGGSGSGSTESESDCDRRRRRLGDG